MRHTSGAILAVASGFPFPRKRLFQPLSDLSRSSVHGHLAWEEARCFLLARAHPTAGGRRMLAQP